VVTSGSLQGFVFLVEQLVQPGARVVVEAPTYDRPLKILARLGAEVVPVSMDDEGLIPEALEQALAQGPKPAFVYTIATFQNPSGRTLSTERRRRVVELAREHEVLVLEDDPYGLVRYEGEAPPTLFELEGGTNVVYASSFSKTVAPGVRVGYSCCRRSSPRSRPSRSRRTSHRPSLRRRPCTSFCAAATSSRPSSA
jgi:DNA-binding transcriptional MocR family regulator